MVNLVQSLRFRVAKTFFFDITACFVPEPQSSRLETILCFPEETVPAGSGRQDPPTLEVDCTDCITAEKKKTRARGENVTQEFKYAIILSFFRPLFFFNVTFFLLRRSLAHILTTLSLADDFIKAESLAHILITGYHKKKIGKK